MAVGASTCASGSQVWNGKIGTLTANPIKKPTNTHIWKLGSASACPWVAAKVMSVGISKVRAPSATPLTYVAIEIDRYHRDQHQDATEERIKEKLNRSVFSARSAPDTDKEIHGQQCQLEKDVE